MVVQRGSSTPRIEAKRSPTRSLPRAVLISVHNADVQARHTIWTDGAKPSTVVKGPMTASIKCLLVEAELGVEGWVIWVLIRPKNNDLLVIRYQSHWQNSCIKLGCSEIHGTYKWIDCLCVRLLVSGQVRHVCQNKLHGVTAITVTQPWEPSALANISGPCSNEGH